MMGRTLSERERWWLLGGAAALAVILLGALVVSPYLKARDDLQRKIDRASSLLEDIEQARPEVARLRERLAQAPRSAGRPQSATAVVENTAAAQGLRERLLSLRPQPVSEGGELAESLEVGVEKASLEELIRWLYALENAPGGQKVVQLRLRKRFDNRELFDATLSVVRYRPGEAR